VSALEQVVAEMRAEKAGAAGHERGWHAPDVTASYLRSLLDSIWNFENTASTAWLSQKLRLVC
jgi:hypothetical protein